MSFRYSELVIDLSEYCGQATATRAEFCPTASATIEHADPAPLNLDVLREQLRAALRK
jgi:hypothetical protein